MAFPNSPIDNELYTNSIGVQYRYSTASTAWFMVGAAVTGDQGVTGLQGLTGLMGIDGLTGIQGLTGLYIQGVTGLAGDTGIMGVTGMALGQTGIQGLTGFMGIDGQTGIQGQTGLNALGVYQSVSSRTTFLRQSAPTLNFGAVTTMYVSNYADNTQNTLMYWPLPSGTTINSGYIRLVAAGGTVNEDMTCNLHRMTHNWVVGSSRGVGYEPDTTHPGCTWDKFSAPGSNYWTTPGGDYDSTVLGSFVVPSGVNTGTFYLNLNATGVEAIQTMINGDNTKYGFALTCDPAIGSNIFFMSANNQELYPFDNLNHPTLILSTLAQGDTGINGLQGETGIQGVTGFYGQTGIKGQTGIQGNTGIRGVTGLYIQGQTGVQGDTGIQGNTGIRGLTGLYIQGNTGIMGVTGLTGDTGIQGLTGLYIQGQTGVAGLTGGTGIQGLTGLYIQGVTGLAGDTGIMGVTGMALGQTGIQGVTGFQGVTGLRGLTGLYIQGVTGLALGATGIQGVTGLRGLTGLYIQGVTGLYIQGNTGIQGVTGFRGVTGLANVQGVTGLYIQGITGLRGITGLTGVTGIQGVTGLALGATGIQGNTGLTVGNPSYGECYASTGLTGLGATTTCTNLGTFYLLAVTTTAGTLTADITQNNSGRLTYTGADTKTFYVVGTGNIIFNTVSTRYNIRLAKGGTSIVNSNKYVAAGVVSAQFPFHAASFVSLATNEYVEVYIECNTAGGTLTAPSYHLTVESV